MIQTYTFNGRNSSENGLIFSEYEKKVFSHIGERKSLDNGKYERCSYDEAMIEFTENGDLSKARYLVISADKWQLMKHLKQTHYEKKPSRYIFKRPVVV